MAGIRIAVVSLVCILAASGVRSQIAGTPALGRNGMVASASPAATRVGVEVLREGGNAVDAAVAVAFALAVTLPEAGNLGGGGFAVLRLRGGIEVALDFRETAPRRATPDRYLDANGKPDTRRSITGGLAVGVPGSVAGLCHLAARYGSQPLDRLVLPAIRLAREGFPMPQSLRTSLQGREARDLLSPFDESRRVFLDGAGRLATGAAFSQPELAKTLELIARSGPDVFYRGAIADLMLAEIEKAGGVMTRDDLEGYRVKDRAPLVGTYRGCRIITMPPPSSGGVALLEALGVLERFNLGELGFGSEQRTHILAECMRRVFKDRAVWMGDPDFAWVPVRSLTSPRYLRRLSAQIRDDATPSDGLELPDPLRVEKGETTHLSVVDRMGNAVALTTTLNGSFGSGITVTGAGFLLNNEMDDFAVAPGLPNMYGLVQGERNKIEPGKRPLSSMTPTIVERQGGVILVVGSPGGPTIISTVLQIILNVVDHRMTVSQAVASPRIHHQWMPDRLQVEPFGLAPEVIEGLRDRGHRIAMRGSPGNPSFQGDAQVIGRFGGAWAGASDPRHGGLALGY